MKTIKELNKELNEKAWYRFLKVLWVGAYFILLILIMSYSKPKDLTEAVLIFALFTISYVGATTFLKRVVCYAADYVVYGKVLLKEKWYSLVLIALWGVPSILVLIAFLADLSQVHVRR